MTSSISLDTLTEKQKTSLSKFRESTKDIVNPEQDDHFLLRWLIARNFDQKKSRQMLNKHMTFRQEWGVDKLLSEYKVPEVLKLYYPGGVCGYDNEGCPVWVGPVGGFDWKGLTMSLKRRDILRHVVWTTECMVEDFKRQTTKLGHRVDKFVFVMDMEGYGFSKMLSPGADTVFEIFDMVERNYPEVLKSIIIVNATSALPIIYNMTKPFLHDATKKKICILGRNWKEHLQSCIPVDQLPVKWGGEMTEDGDPACPTKVPPGGEVDPCYYVEKDSNQQDMEKMLHISLSRACSFHLEYPVKKGQLLNIGLLKGVDLSGSVKHLIMTMSGVCNEPVCLPSRHKTLKWIFWTRKHDIKFSVVHRDESGKKTDAVSVRRVTCNVVPEDGCCQSTKDGTYVVRFDNSYSWTHSKSLNYLIEVITPDSGIEDSADTDNVTDQLAHMTLE